MDQTWIKPNLGFGFGSYEEIPFSFIESPTPV
jgi:hypothetical protein